MWEVIEDKINAFLSLIKRVTGILWLETKIKAIGAKIKAKQAQKTQKIKEKGAIWAQKTKETTTKALVHFRSVDIRKVKIGSVLGLFGAVLLPLAAKIKTWYMALKPTTIAIFTMVSTAGMVGGISVYKSVKSINDESSAKVKVEEKVFYGKKRGTYHNVDAKQLLVSQVSVPIYIESATDVRTLIIDFTLEMSNRYLKEYFFRNDHKIKDRLAHSMEEIIPGFPLTLEGQQIIKNKIIKEINLLIKELQIQGIAKDVYFHSILAG